MREARTKEKASFLVLFLFILLLSACGQAPLDEPVKASPPPSSRGEYGKFVIYKSGEGNLKTLGYKDVLGAVTKNVFYHVSEVRYNPYFVLSDYQPSQDIYIYNKDYIGDGRLIDGTTADNNLLYKDSSYSRFDIPVYGDNPDFRIRGGSSDHPDALVDNGTLYFYYLNPPRPVSAPPGGGVDFMLCSDSLGNQNPQGGPDLRGAVEIDTTKLNCRIDLTLANEHWFYLKVSETTPFSARVVSQQVQGVKGPKVELSLHSSPVGSTIISSRYGLDYFYWTDPYLGYILKANTPYYLKVSVLDPGATGFIRLWLFATPNSAGLLKDYNPKAKIGRAKIQSARSGNPELDGGETFEPDDLSTPVEDNFPDCDGIPDSGDEGDFGVNESTYWCSSGMGFSDLTIGLKDGAMQYWEVDKKENIDDGEYFIGEFTNLWSNGNEAPSVIKVGNEYWMFISAGAGIYQLKSEDGINFDLTNLINDRPSLLIRGLSVEKGDSDGPVVSSGRYGYCESFADGDDVEKVPVEKKGDIEIYRGYPGSIGITYGENGVLESYPMVDTQEGEFITTGPDGIINTFFFPKCVHYEPPIYKDVISVATEGPGNPDASCSGIMVDILNGATIAVLGSDTSAYLLGDDEWAVDSLGINPAKYWRKQGCNLFSIAEEIDRCALGKPHSISALAGSDGKLDTVVDILPGDDYLCPRFGDVLICSGPNGKFDDQKLDWAIEQSLEVDDYLCAGEEAGEEVVAICPGANKVINTPIAPNDVLCDDEVKVCPGVDGILDSLKWVYYTDKGLKRDLYDQYDDQFRVLETGFALHPGPNNYFQIYQLYKKQEIEHYETVDELIENFQPRTGDCYDLEIVKVWDEFYETERDEYGLFEYKGLMFDDELAWDPNTNQFFIRTGKNGVNQSCISDSDHKLIARHRGEPFILMIKPGANGILESYPMKDELVYHKRENERDIPKISTGPDGIMNSFRIGDDFVEIMFGMGAADYPCIVAGPDGIAQSIARGNDNQLYKPGEKTGFDSFQIGTPDVVREGDNLYLFYTGLGWQTSLDCMPSSPSALGSLGECKRPGFDNKWGNLSYQYSDTISSIYERSLVTRDLFPNYALINALDDNPGVMLAPRIGVATAKINELKANPSAWRRVLYPVVDIGKIGASSLELDISLGGVSLSGSGAPVFNFLGSFSPDVFVSYEESNDKPIFLMFFNGIFSRVAKPHMSAADPTEGIVTLYYQIGLARSVAPLIKWDPVTDMNPAIVLGILQSDLEAALTGDPYGYVNPTVFRGEGDTYAMIYKQMEFLPQYDPAFHTSIEREWLGLALRVGYVYPGLISCEINSVNRDYGNSRNGLIQASILVLPLCLIVALRIFARRG